jgi:hypothetical protein
LFHDPTGNYRFRSLHGHGFGPDSPLRRRSDSVGRRPGHLALLAGVDRGGPPPAPGPGVARRWCRADACGAGDRLRGMADVVAPPRPSGPHRRGARRTRAGVRARRGRVDSVWSCPACCLAGTRGAGAPRQPGVVQRVPAARCGGAPVAGGLGAGAVAGGVLRSDGLVDAALAMAPRRPLGATRSTRRAAVRAGRSVRRVPRANLARRRSSVGFAAYRPTAWGVSLCGWLSGVADGYLSRARGVGRFDHGARSRKRRGGGGRAVISGPVDVSAETRAGDHKDRQLGGLPEQELHYGP